MIKPPFLAAWRYSQYCAKLPFCSFHVDLARKVLKSGFSADRQCETILFHIAPLLVKNIRAKKYALMFSMAYIEAKLFQAQIIAGL